MFRIVIVTLILLFAVLADPPLAKDLEVSVRFSDREMSIIVAYYRQHSDQPKTNGKGKKALPPGIAKNLSRGKPLPPGIAKKELPADLLNGLPPAPTGYERIVVAGKVLLVEIATQVIHDILEDALLN